jgi:transposase
MMNPYGTNGIIHPAHRSSILNAIPVESIYIHCGYVDMRRSIDGLAATVKQVYKLDPCARTLYLFCGRDSGKIKGLLWEGDGWLLLYKRLENGGRFQWPRKESEARLITPQQLRWLLEGLSIEQPRALRKVSSVLVV